MEPELQYKQRHLGGKALHRLQIPIGHVAASRIGVDRTKHLGLGAQSMFWHASFYGAAHGTNFVHYRPARKSVVFGSYFAAGIECKGGSAGNIFFELGRRQTGTNCFDAGRIVIKAI